MYCFDVGFSFNNKWTRHCSFISSPPADNRTAFNRKLSEGLAVYIVYGEITRKLRHCQSGLRVVQVKNC